VVSTVNRFERPALESIRFNGNNISWKRHATDIHVEVESRIQDFDSVYRIERLLKILDDANKKDTKRQRLKNFKRDLRADNDVGQPNSEVTDSIRKYLNDKNLDRTSVVVKILNGILDVIQKT